MGIATGTQNVYHLRDSAMPAFNQMIMAGSVAAADPADVNQGVTVVRVQWNMADLPPAGSAARDLPAGLRVAGRRRAARCRATRLAREAGRHNNMSYREIAFADFDLLDDTGAGPLPSSIVVDAFGTPVIRAFQLRFTQAIGSFLTERLLVEIERTSDNGSVEKALFPLERRRLGAARSGRRRRRLGEPRRAGHHRQRGAGGRRRQTAVTFAGDFACALQHQKVALRAVIHSARPGAKPVEIAEESFDVQVIAQAPPTTGTATGSDPPQADSLVFTDFATLAQPQPADKSFGPIDAGRFRITSVFQASSATKAYAVAPGVVMVQQVDAQRVNLVLRPLQQPGLGMTPVKYYVYRGLRLDHFLDPANPSLVRPLAGAPELVSRLWPIHIGQNGAAPFSSVALGFDPANQPATARIDQFFFAAGSTIQYALAKGGEWLGDFFHSGGNEFGFEILLEEGTAQPTFQNIRQATHVIDVSTLPATSDSERFARSAWRGKRS